MQTVQEWPPRDAANAPFWEAAVEGRLLLRRGGDQDWIEASGFGVIAAVGAPDASAPGTPATIALDEGLSVRSVVVGPGAADAAPGQRVRCVFAAEGDGVNVPQYVLDGP